MHDRLAKAKKMAIECEEERLERRSRNLASKRKQLENDYIYNIILLVVDVVYAITCNSIFNFRFFVLDFRSLSIVDFRFVGCRLLIFDLLVVDCRFLILILVARVLVLSSTSTWIIYLRKVGVFCLI